MRPERTLMENMSIKTLLSFIRSCNQEVEIDNSITDSPDALITIEGKKISVECRNFFPAEILKLPGINAPKEGCFFEAVIPLEPHLWVRNAIREKQKKIGHYKDKTNCSEVWLLIHPPYFTNLGMEKSGPEGDIPNLLYFGAQNIEHGFDRIFYFELTDNQESCFMTCIYGEGTPSPSITPQEFIDKNPPYPIKHILWGNVEVVGGEKGSPNRLRVNLNNTEKIITSQPLDKRYKIDFSKLELPDRWKGNHKFSKTALYSKTPIS